VKEMSVPETRFDGRASEIAREIAERRPTITPADVVLLVIPSLLAAGVIAAWLSALSVHGALFVACLPALVTLGYALFYDPPAATDRRD